MTDDLDFTTDQLKRWLAEARDLENNHRNMMLFWRRTRRRLEARLELKTDQEQAVREAEWWLEE